MKKIVIGIGSKNKAKIRATKFVAVQYFGNSNQLEFLDLDVASQVSNQPMTDEECIEGIFFTKHPF